jgi:hypothetical protein
MDLPFDHGWSTAIRHSETFTDGYEVLRLKGDQPATVTKVQLTGAGGLEQVGAKIASPARRCSAPSN